MSITKYTLKYYNSYYFARAKCWQSVLGRSILLLQGVTMQKISELKQEDFIYNHVVYDNEAERHLAKHSHPLTEMIYVLGGEVSYTIENKRFTAQKGDLILI